jgi:hypothetical protein
MINARIELTDPFGGPDLLALVVPISSGYGSSPEQALDLVTLALTAAEWPVLLDASGQIIHVPQSLLRSVATW